MEASAWVSIAWSIAMIALNAFFLNYAYQLGHHGCTCAQTWRRKYIEFTLVLFILVGAASLVGWRSHVPWVGMLLLAVTIAYVVVTRLFIEDVQDKKCECAQTIAFDALNIVNIINMVSLGIVALGVVVMIILWLRGGSSAVRRAMITRATRGAMTATRGR